MRLNGKSRLWYDDNTRGEQATVPHILIPLTGPLYFFSRYTNYLTLLLPSMQATLPIFMVRVSTETASFRRQEQFRVACMIS